MGKVDDMIDGFVDFFFVDVKLVGFVCYIDFEMVRNCVGIDLE